MENLHSMMLEQLRSTSKQLQEITAQLAQKEVSVKVLDESKQSLLKDLQNQQLQFQRVRTLSFSLSLSHFSFPRCSVFVFASLIHCRHSRTLRNCYR